MRDRPVCRRALSAHLNAPARNRLIRQDCASGELTRGEMDGSAQTANGNWHERSTPRPVTELPLEIAPPALDGSSREQGTGMTASDHQRGCASDAPHCHWDQRSFL